MKLQSEFVHHLMFLKMRYCINRRDLFFKRFSFFIKLTSCFIIFFSFVFTQNFCGFIEFGNSTFLFFISTISQPAKFGTNISFHFVIIIIIVVVVVIVVVAVC